MAAFWILGHMDARPFPTTFQPAQPRLLSQWFPCQALFVKVSHADKRMLLRATEQNTLLLQAGWKMGMAYQLLSTLGPSTSFWLHFVQQKPWFTECLKKIQTCLLKVSTTCVMVRWTGSCSERRCQANVALYAGRRPFASLSLLQPSSLEVTKIWK